MVASRIANVSVVLIGPPGSAERDADPLAALLPLLFEDVIRLAGADGAMARAEAIVAARGERVIVVREGEGRATAELLLALVAWPERAIVEVAGDDPAAGGEPICSIHRRADLVKWLPALRGRAGLASDLAGLLPEGEVERVDLARLGLDDGPIAIFAVGPNGRHGPNNGIRTLGTAG